MGNYKFRFSDMIPNAWFHKLKNMNKPTPNYTKTLNHSKKKIPAPEFTNSDQRKSYYFTRDLTLQPDSPTKPPTAAEPPRRSSRRRRSNKRSRAPRPPPRLVSSTISAGCTCGAAVESVWARTQTDSSSQEECTNSGPDQSSSSEPDSILTEYGSGPDSSMLVSWPSPCIKCGTTTNDIVIDVISGVKGGSGGAEEDQCRRLPRIITRKSDDIPTAAAATISPARRIPAKPPGMKLRVNSPRIVGRRRSVSSNSSSAASSRRSISESFAVVKASKDPRRDFRESMVEMILENNIRASNDLEELLACYLSLNSDEYHDLIINVFKQIWFDFIHLRLK
ncbi:transcription repressor OFP1-like [Salvia miltiorrhiza]|uniref:transcription repressor OFP1-like n=1 Tax=Salvia miltiorrhiza TaxID=226208 RepID=UPI0025AC5636|nr:transcription repressor OFP1-like [Salvia miltiorrhiza]